MQLKPSLALATLFLGLATATDYVDTILSTPEDLLATSTAYAPDQQETPSSSATLILDEDTTTIDPAFPLPTTTETTTDYDDTDYPTQSPLPSSSSFTDSLLPQPSHTTGIYPQPSNGTIVTVSTSSSAEEPATVTETAAEPESTEHNDEPTQSSDDSNEDDDTRPTGTTTRQVSSPTPTSVNGAVGSMGVMKSQFGLAVVGVVLGVGLGL